jgi:hypothetical protein
MGKMRADRPVVKRDEGGRKVRGTLDLTPALSSEERENRIQRVVIN